jgi:plasmid stabilization system protein ParE
MAFLVETTPESERDAEAILEWLFSQHAGDTGIRWFLALEDAIASLAIAPARCPLAPENADFPFEVRHLLYGRRPHVYRILFTIQGDQGFYPAYPPRTPSEYLPALTARQAARAWENGEGYAFTAQH